MDEPLEDPRVSALPERLLGRSDLARLFGVTRETIRKWERAGKLPAPLLVGVRPFWKPGVIAAWFDRPGQ